MVLREQVFSYLYFSYEIDLKGKAKIPTGPDKPLNDLVLSEQAPLSTTSRIGEGISKPRN